MTSTNKQGLKIVIAYLAVWFAALILQVVLALQYADSSGEIIMTSAQEVRLVSITNLALYLTLTIIFIFTLRSFLKKELNLVKENIHEYIKITILGVSGLFAVVYASALVMSLLDVSSVSDNQEALNRLLDSGWFDKTSLVLFSVFLAPFVEEIVFRKAVFGFFEKISVPLAILASGLLFGFIHVLSGDYVQLIAYGSLGLVLAYTYYKSNKNIIAVITIHMIYNLIITLVLFVT